MAKPIAVAFSGASAGEWRVTRIAPVIGETLAEVSHLTTRDAVNARWVLRGTTGHHRYVYRPEADALTAAQEGLGRPQATCAALIPIRKNDAWWSLAQDERRAIFEESSRHIAEGLKYLPAIARRLYHSRELGEPFDFLTWFEFSPTDAARFEDLVSYLRSTEEWKYVDGEVDIRLRRE